MIAVPWRLFMAPRGFCLPLFVCLFLTIPKRGKEGSEKVSVLPELTQLVYAADWTQT